MLARALTWVALGAAFSASSAAAQSVDDGVMLPRRTAMAGVVYGHDSWSEYWEGTLKRSNGNIGTLTTQSVTFVGGYGVTDRVGFMVALPYIRTHASQGVLHDLSGYQDITIAAKLALFSTGRTSRGTLAAFVAGAGALPVSSYTPDFYPLSIGTGGGRATGHLTLNYESPRSWYATASSAYTWCSNVRLNRDAYYADGRLYLTNEVVMPNVVEHTVTAGFARGALRLPVSVVQRRTLGGGDIRRQDMPFVSNRMDFTRLEGGVMYGLPANLSVRAAASRVLTGRNVGQSTTFTSGVFYALHL